MPAGDHTLRTDYVFVLQTLVFGSLSRPLLILPQTFLILLMVVVQQVLLVSQKAFQLLSAFRMLPDLSSPM